MGTPRIRYSRVRYGIYLLDAAALGPVWYGYLKFTGLIEASPRLTGFMEIPAGRAAFGTAVLASCLVAAMLHYRIAKGPVSAAVAGLLLPIIGGGLFGGLWAAQQAPPGGVVSLFEFIINGAYFGGLYPFQDPNALLLGIVSAGALYPVARWSQNMHLWRSGPNVAKAIPSGR